MYDLSTTLSKLVREIVDAPRAGFVISSSNLQYLEHASYVAVLAHTLASKGLTVNVIFGSERDVSLYSNCLMQGVGKNLTRFDLSPTRVCCYTAGDTPAPPVEDLSPTCSIHFSTIDAIQNYSSDVLLLCEYAGEIPSFELFGHEKIVYLRKNKSINNL